MNFLSRLGDILDGLLHRVNGLVVGQKLLAAHIADKSVGLGKFTHNVADEMGLLFRKQRHDRAGAPLENGAFGGGVR